MIGNTVNRPLDEDLDGGGGLVFTKVKFSPLFTLNKNFTYSLKIIVLFLNSFDSL